MQADPGANEQVRVDTPLGPFRARIGPRGIAEFYFPPLDALRLPHPSELGDAPEIHADSSLPAARALVRFCRAYFQRRSAPLPPLDHTGLTAFHCQVARLAQSISVGNWRTYGQLAVDAGQPGAARAVGGVMRNNRHVLLVPCHRVLANGGRLGGFMGGTDERLELKRWLLEWEMSWPEASPWDIPAQEVKTNTEKY